MALGFISFVGESRPASRRYPLKGTMSRAVGRPSYTHYPELAR